MQDFRVRYVAPDPSLHTRTSYPGRGGIWEHMFDPSMLYARLDLHVGAMGILRKCTGTNAAPQMLDCAAAGLAMSLRQKGQDGIILRCELYLASETASPCLCQTLC